MTKYHPDKYETKYRLSTNKIKIPTGEYTPIKYGVKIITEYKCYIEYFGKRVTKVICNCLCCRNFSSTLINWNKQNQMFGIFALGVANIAEKLILNPINTVRIVSNANV